MSAEIRKLKDGDINVYPITTGSAVTLDDGTTVQDFVDKKNTKSNNGGEFKVVVAKCIPSHPKIGMRYYYPGGIFGVDGGAQIYYMDDEGGTLIGPLTPHVREFYNLANSRDVPEPNMNDPYNKHANMRTAYLLITIVDENTPGAYKIQINENVFFYISISHTPDLNCNTYSPFLRVINGVVRNVERIEPPTKVNIFRRSSRINEWAWLNKNFPKESQTTYEEGISYAGLRFRFQSSMSDPVYIQYKTHRSYDEYSNYSYYNVYHEREQRVKLKKPHKKTIRFYTYNDYPAYRAAGTTPGHIWKSNLYFRSKYKFNKKPYKIIHMTDENARRINGKSTHIFGCFLVKTFRKGRRSMDQCLVTACVTIQFKYNGDCIITELSTQNGYLPWNYENNMRI